MGLDLLSAPCGSTASPVYSVHGVGFVWACCSARRFRRFSVRSFFLLIPVITSPVARRRGWSSPDTDLRRSSMFAWPVSPSSNGIAHVALQFVNSLNIIRCTWIVLTLAIEHEHRLKCRAHSCLNFFSYCRRYNRTPMGWVPMPLCFISLFRKKVDLHSHGTCCWAEDVGLHAVGVPNFCL